MLNKLKVLREKSENGFTLIELLVVILIIGILASIAIPVFLNQRKTANDAVAISDIKQASIMLETWLIENPDSAVLPYAGDINFKKSPGVSIHLSRTTTGTVANGYQICAWHVNGKNFISNEVGALYDSNTGGLKQGSQACVAGGRAFL